ncbi:TRAP transporter small permease subunit [Alkalinema pantanalense CENA528]|uniref:TRAP transporter small permease subunit n=1 Tax=Alkalinema pantanalense TaxID=1620705 RepID=UPI003D6F70D3
MGQSIQHPIQFLVLIPLEANTLRSLQRWWRTAPPKLLPLSRAIDRLNEQIGQGVLWLVLVMVGLGVWNVIGRYLGRTIGQNLTSNAFIEGQWYTFDILFLLGAAYALLHDEHVRVDIFYTHWSPRKKAIANLIGSLFYLLPFCVLVAWFSWGSVVESWAIWEGSPDPGGLPRYPIKALILVSCFLLFLQGISEAIKNWAILTGDRDAKPESHESEI